MDLECLKNEHTAAFLVQNLNQTKSNNLVRIVKQARGFKTIKFSPIKKSRTKHSVTSACFTEPFAAVQLHPHADVHGVIRDGHEAHEASDDGRLQVLEHNVVGVPVPFDHLQVRQTPMKEKPTMGCKI